MASRERIKPIFECFPGINLAQSQLDLNSSNPQSNYLIIADYGQFKNLMKIHSLCLRPTKVINWNKLNYTNVLIEC